MAEEAQYLAPPLEPNPTSLEQLFNEYMEANIFGWKGAAGNLDNRIAGGLSLIAAQLQEAASDGATNLFRYYGANIVSIPPKEAQYATGNTTWTATDTLGHSIPAGTVAVWTDAAGNRHGFETLAEATIANGKSTVTGVAVRAVEPGPESNGLSGPAIELASPLSFVSKVEFEAPTLGGLEAELDAAYLARLKQQAQTLSPKPIVAKDFNTILLNAGVVGRATTIGGFNPEAILKPKAKTEVGTVVKLTSLTTANITIGTILKTVAGTIKAGTFVTEIINATEVRINQAAEKAEEKEFEFEGLINQQGYVTSWIGNSKGEALTAEQEKTEENALQEKCLVGVVYKVRGPTATTINVEATVFAWPGQSTTVIKESIETALKSYLSGERWGNPNAKAPEWQNDPKVRIVSVEHAILQVVGTHYVAELKLNSGTTDIVMGGVVAVPKIGTITLTVKNG